ncbi:unnamed protein product, partial [Rotaria magnacalcarata]
TKNNRTYSELVYGVHIRRRPLYYIFNVIIPCAMLSCLTCMSFWLPTSSGEKVTLGLTCFVAFSVFMLMVAEKVPATSDTVPIIGIYLTIVMSLTSISVIMAVIVANVYQQAAMCASENHRAPQWLIKFALIINMYPNMKMTRNHSWENWGLNGFVTGVLLIIIGILTQVLEYPRIYNGPANYNNNLYTMSNYYNHWWPWTYAASTFGLFTLLAGIMGILAGVRRSYGTILSFSIMCLFSTLFAIYLIVYFAIIVRFYQQQKSAASQLRSIHPTSYSITITQLVIASLNALVSLTATILAGRAITLGVPKGVFFDDAESSASFGLSLEPNPFPVTSNNNELDTNYESMIENLLLQQVLLYTQERSKSTQRLSSPSSAANSLLVRQQSNAQNDQNSLLNSSIYDNDDDEPTLCLIEARRQNSSDLIENILSQYIQRHDSRSNFDQNLMELIVKRNRERRKVSTFANNVFNSRLQWLAIGLVIDRLFFSIYFAATVISYLVTLWFIPFSHPTLTININKL